MHLQRTKVAMATAAVTLLAGLGLWVGYSSGDEASDRPSDEAASSQAAVPEPTSGDESPPASEGDDESVKKKKDRGPSGSDVQTPDGSPDATEDGPGADASDDPTEDGPSADATDGSPDESTDDAGDGPQSETTPTPGVGETVPVGAVQTEAPVPIDSVGDFGTGLTVRLSDITSVQGEAKAPGEIAGPAVSVTVAAANDSKTPVSLDGVVVFVSYGKDRVPASQFGSSSDPLVGDLPARGTRSGTYVYAVPPDARDDVRVEISYTGSAPTVAFEGSLDG